MTIELKIEGMSCQHCVARTEKALSAVPGVGRVEVRLEPGSATVEGDGLDLVTLIQAVEEAGYTAAEG